MHPLASLDQRYVWHPFTQMRDWAKREPLVIVGGRGAELQDVHGRTYLDANSSIWTNLHGHNHPQINRAIRAQLRRIAHSSALGFANEPASLLAEQLILSANPSGEPKSSGVDNGGRSRTPQTAEPALSPELAKVFFSDDGSTALEVALKLAFEFTRRTRSAGRPRFLGLAGGYHGDTVGAVSLGHIDLFHKAYAPLLFRTDSVMAPYCYRCRFNRAKPQRQDARLYRKCHWECLDQVERAFAKGNREGRPYSAFVFEPLVQGAAGIIPQPAGWLRGACAIAREHGALLIADEVMTGFGRTGIATTATNGLADGSPRPEGTRSLFACHQEDVQPDFLALAKGLTGGYLPMAATLTTQTVFNAFLGRYEQFKSFFHGHSFTGNQLGAAAALASLAMLQGPASQKARAQLESALQQNLRQLWAYPQVGDIRQVGLVVGVELVRNWRTREPFALRERAGIRVCEAMATKGILTRPIGNVVVLMPPYCTTGRQVERMIDALGQSVSETVGPATIRDTQRRARPANA